jgi:hypothetical protein
MAYEAMFATPENLSISCAINFTYLLPCATMKTSKDLSTTIFCYVFQLMVKSDFAVCYLDHGKIIFSSCVFLWTL